VDAPDEGCEMDILIGYIISWCLYIPHQIISLWIVYKAQQEKPKYQTEWRWYNWWMFYLHCFFVPMKMITNAITYNALSLKIPLWVA
jgi:hypothetical protein